MDSTDWRRYDVPGMWSMISGFDTGPQWTQVGGWRKASELSVLHLARLRSYRDRLATAWPPERNEASRTYLAELDRLIGSVQATYDASLANHGAVAGATAAISTARHKLKPLYDQWRSNESVMATYEARVAAAASGRPAPTPPPAPLSPGWRESLNTRARAVMDAASTEIAQATYRLVRPPDYIAPRLSTAVMTASPLSVRPFLRPVVPPVVPTPAPANAHRAASRPTEPAVVSGKGGGAPPLAVRPRSGTRFESQRIPLPAVIGPGPTRAKAPSVESRPRPVPPSTLNGSTDPARRPLPPGGVIGTQPGLVFAPGPSSGPAQRTNPIGGVIGPNLAAAAPPPATRSPSPRPNTSIGAADAVFRTPDGHLVTISDRTTQWGGERRTREPLDPDDPWAVVDGVPPIIEPAPEPRFHDPGPAIGLDRRR